MANENTTYIIYLINLAKSGRHSGFLELCELHLKTVFTVIYRLISNVDLAKKLSVDTFVTVWDDIKDFNPDRSFIDYIKNIAIEHAIMELTKYAHSPAPEKKIELPVSNMDRIEILIKHLPPEQKVIFILHDLEGFSYEKLQKFFPDMIYDELKTILIEARQSIISKLTL